MPYVSAVDDQLDGDYPNLCPGRPKAAALGSTADYHRSLLDQHHDSTSSQNRKTLDLEELQADEDPSFCPKSRISSRWGDKSRHRSQATSSKYQHSGLTQQDLEEFESLPLAIRRKVSRSRNSFFNSFNMCRSATRLSHSPSFDDHRRMGPG